ncbi:shikimate dehydrogenase [Marixanthomonas sp. SCSIO 43207]|uniref:shikimate dehydrogenase family protein n=1 Tax=Marixanthomonas sp. SCSIO 43207 TaxID=2779360 RepID=UPI001CAA0149|nr:shikimate dehydrogenase [Marixanthomonas sp. SCSIO 43207]UAB81073.1 shikimate dehydrogenase [Marixanthomonas sp. SCSIO 43207]
MAKYGLVGKDIAYSFSKTFFSIKFEKENRQDTYHNFDIESIDQFPKIISENPDLKGLNVTIPYKEAIIPFLDRIDKEAQEIGAINTIKFQNDGSLKGYNTDHYGFAKALANFLPLKDKSALILGTGGASKAIKYVLKTMGFRYQVVSRKKTESTITYSSLNKQIIEDHCLIINCTPLGTSPNISACPTIPYQFISKDHLLFDLIYNPSQTEFLKLGRAQGAKTSNGLKMLEHQAKKAWKIWRS